jgi:hypothetical protein
MLYLLVDAGLLGSGGGSTSPVGLKPYFPPSDFKISVASKASLGADFWSLKH